MQIGNSFRGDIIRINLLILLCFLFSNINANSANYIIKNNNSTVGYCSIIYSGINAKEINLLFDGFSKEYTETYYNLIDYPNIKIKKYIMSNTLPIEITYRNNKLIKKFNSYSIKTVFKKNEEYFPISIGNSIFTVLLLNKYKKSKALSLLSSQVFNIKYTSNGFRYNNTQIDIFGKYPFPDSMKIGNYTYIKGNYKQPLNPYKGKKYIVSKYRYQKKKYRKKIRINNIYGEYAWNKTDNDNKVIIILPADLYSDMYGNLYNKYHYTIFQIAENINYPTFIFDFNTISIPDIKTIKTGIKDIIDYFRNSNKRIIIIAFSNLYLALNDIDIDVDYIIAINPPINNYRDFAKRIFDEYKNIKGFPFSSFDNFLRYDPFNKQDIDLKTKNHFYIFSKSILNKNEIDYIRSLNLKGLFINNIDRRLYYCNIKNTEKFFINKNVLRLLNSIIKKI